MNYKLNIQSTVAISKSCNSRHSSHSKSILFIIGNRLLFVLEYLLPMKIQIPVPLFSCDVPLLSECRSEWSWCSTDMIRSGAVVVGGFPPVTRTQHNTNLHYQPHACLYYNKVYKNILQLHKANQKHIAHGHY